jgi:Mg2+ and Co2+ transporter CorA
MLPSDNEKVPGFKKWSYWYALVIGFLAVLILLFYLLTKHFA